MPATTDDDSEKETAQQRVFAGTPDHNPMQLHCLGTAGYHPNEMRHTSCYFVPDTGLLLDAGTGIFRLPSLLKTETLDILLSHAHLDHIVGLTFLLDILYQHPLKQVRVFGEAEKINAIRTLVSSEFIFPVELPVQWCAIDEDYNTDGQQSFDVAGAHVSWRRQEHPGGSVAYRIEWPAQERVLLYATDTVGASEDAMLDWMKGTDVLLHECNFHDNQVEWAIKTGHCYLDRVAQISAVTQPKRVLLTHVNPIDEMTLNANENRFAMPCEVVSDRQIIEF
ncbi:MBL fold metallo-hydrolase [Aporhodopirellula aestuarii]|uniref:MBL fold metallo-hydrolase n=1 Tax=Aporhodopirellula aestuarii TaxID=2950107 RepID=A0ABT0U341_9BACT|nr:MBL fold metallo-hydrolase [Aporhodopirellula aestuarii]MCM2371297.1 MBL fold metallo-hydrolase [Aporhodopirellula aestuarii]